MISVTIPRTVAPKAVRKPKTPRKIPMGRIGRMFPIARDIVSASSHARRAEILLRLPDAVVLSHGDVLAAACREAEFIMGVHFLTQRSAVLFANRGLDGQLPEHCTRTLTIWHRGMASIAGREE